MMIKRCSQTLLTIAALCMTMNLMSCSSDLDIHNPNALHTIRALQNALENAGGGESKDNPIDIAFDGHESANQIYKALAAASKYVCLDLSESSVSGFNRSSAHPSGTNMIVSLDLPETMTAIEASAFSNWSNLQEISMPHSVTAISENAFYGCSALFSIEIPKDVNSIGSGAFSGCTSLLSIKIPKNVSSIGSGAFSGCSNLSRIIFKGSNTVIADNTVFPDGASLKEAAGEAAASGNSAYKAKQGTYIHKKDEWQKN